MSTVTYPSHFESDVVLRNGRTLHIRPVRPEDRDTLLAFYRGLSRDSLYMRFFDMRTPDAALRDSPTNVDYETDFGIVSELGGELAGIISERDYARKVILLGRSSAETPVWQIMSSPAITVTPEESVQRCMEIMTERRIRHLPVVDSGRMVGMISIGDCVRAVIEDQKDTIQQLERFISG